MRPMGTPSPRAVRPPGVPRHAIPRGKDRRGIGARPRRPATGATTGTSARWQAHHGVLAGLVRRRYRALVHGVLTGAARRARRSRRGVLVHGVLAGVVRRRYRALVHGVLAGATRRARRS